MAAYLGEGGVWRVRRSGRRKSGRFVNNVAPNSASRKAVGGCGDCAVAGGCEPLSYRIALGAQIFLISAMMFWN